MRCEVCTDLSPDLDCDLLAIGVLEGDSLPDPLLALFGPHLEPSYAAESFTGRAETTFEVHTLGRIPARRLVLVGLGKGSDDEVRGAAGRVGLTARKAGAARVGLDLGAAGNAPESVAAAVEGFACGNYRFDGYKDTAKRKRACDLLVIEGESDVAERALVVAEAQAWVRDLVNEPADVLHPESLAERAAALAGPHLSVDVWDEVRLAAEGMAGTLAVGRASAHPPRLIHLHYAPESPRRRVALVGKGLTFDAGGLCLKTAEGMDTMRCDMAGAATVLGALKAASTLNLPVEIHGIVGAAENMPGAEAYKPGDILRMRNGRTVEVHNTDAEGRLVLADCLCLASTLGVESCLDLATLTGACVVALGFRYTGLFTEDDDLAAEIESAAAVAGDGLWRLPLAEHFRKLLDAEWADLSHTGPRWGGASSAAAFLSAFVDGMRWAHLDIAGPAFLEKADRYYVKGATGAPMRTLLRWIEASG